MKKLLIITTLFLSLSSPAYAFDYTTYNTALSDTIGAFRTSFNSLLTSLTSELVGFLTTSTRDWTLYSPTILTPTTTPMGILVNNSTSTITNLTTNKSTSTSATTTDFSITGLLSKLLSTNSSGTVIETTVSSPLGYSNGVLNCLTCLVNPDLVQQTIGGLKYYNASTSQSTNLTWYFTNGFISNASSTVNAGLTVYMSSTTHATTTGTFTLPSTSSLVTNQAGNIGIDTTSGQLRYSDGKNTNALTGTSTLSINLASTTLDAMGKKFSAGTTSILVRNDPEAFTMLGFYCTASTTGTALVRFGDNTNWTETATCTTGGFTPTATNNTWTAFEPLVIQASSTAGTVSRIGVTILKVLTQD